MLVLIILLIFFLSVLNTIMLATLMKNIRKKKTKNKIICINCCGENVDRNIRYKSNQKEYFAFECQDCKACWEIEKKFKGVV